MYYLWALQVLIEDPSSLWDEPPLFPWYLLKGRLRATQEEQQIRARISSIEDLNNCVNPDREIALPFHYSTSLKQERKNKKKHSYIAQHTSDTNLRIWSKTNGLGETSERPPLPGEQNQVLTAIMWDDPETTAETVRGVEVQQQHPLWATEVNYKIRGLYWNHLITIFNIFNVMYW